jgi:hypothetical protein
VIGGFGRRDAGKPPREALVCVRRFEPAPMLQRGIRAEQVAAQRHLYDVRKPSQDLPADYADRIWERYERELPTAIEAIADGACDTRRWSAILAHV